MPLKRRRLSRRSTQYDDEYESASSDYEFDLPVVPSSRPRRQPENVTRRSLWLTTPASNQRRQSIARRQSFKTRCPPTTDRNLLSVDFASGRLSDFKPSLPKIPKKQSRETNLHAEKISPVKRARPTCPKTHASAPIYPSEEEIEPVPTSAQPQARIKRERAKAKAEQMRRDRIIGTLSDRTASRLISMGDVTRDVAQTCSAFFCWDFREWQDVLEGAAVLVYGSFSDDKKSISKRNKHSKKQMLSIGPRVWSPCLQVDALSLCITKSGGTRVQLRNGFRTKKNSENKLKTFIEWDTVEHYSDLKCIFVHRSVIQKFISEESPSLVELTQVKPRVQIFLFGNGEEPALANITRVDPRVDPRVELVFCAGAVIVPTFGSLFKKRTGKGLDGKDCFEKLKEACLHHPFIKVCLHPSMQVQLHNNISSSWRTEKLDVNFLIDFLTQSFDNPKDAQVNSLASWIKLDRNNICWLWSEVNQSSKTEDDEETAEVNSIAATLAEVQKELFIDFRRFIIALPDDHPSSNQLSVKGIELMNISQLCQSLRFGLN